MFYWDGVQIATQDIPGTFSNVPIGVPETTTGTHTVSVRQLLTTATATFTVLGPTVVTNEASSITPTSATFNANLTSMGGYDGIWAWFWLVGIGTRGGGTGYFRTYTGAYSTNVTGLTPNTTYSYYAIADPDEHLPPMAQGSTVSFTTLPASASTPPTVVTNSATNITSTSATINGNLTSMGTYSSVDVFFDYKKSSDNLFFESDTKNMGSTGAFSMDLKSLNPNTSYTFKAGASYTINGHRYASPDAISLSFTTSPVQYTLIVLRDPIQGGTAVVTNPAGAGPYNQGTVVSVSAAPASGWQFVNWTGDAVASASSTDTTITMNGDKTIIANFIQIQYTLNVVASGSGTAAATVAGTYNSGAIVPIIATPASGWQFVNWTGDAVASSSSASTTITMNSNKTVTANFIQITPTTTQPTTAGTTQSSVATTPPPTSENGGGTESGTPIYVWILVAVGALAALGGIAMAISKMRVAPGGSAAREPKQPKVYTSPPAQPTSQPDYIDMLEKLADLRNQGIITEAEFATKKKELLDKMGN